jgi:REP element-mobilizing transposase RayT
MYTGSEGLSLQANFVILGLLRLEMLSFVTRFNISELRDICLKIEKCYEIKFLEIGVDKDHVHFLVQSVPTYSVTSLVKMIKSLTAREIFKRCPHVKKQLWGGEFWSDGYFASTVGKHGDEEVISRYVKEQGKEYLKLYKQAQQLSLF